MISVIIPVYNNRSIEDCLRTILSAKSGSETEEIIVVDNNSSDPEIKKIIQSFPTIKYLVEKKPGSYAARNRGAQAARGKILAFTDADCLADEDWLINIEKNSQQVNGLMGRIEDNNENQIAEWEGRFYQEVTAGLWPVGKDLKRIDTRNFAINKEVFQKMKGFNEKLKYGGDMELGARLHAAGYRIRYCPEAKVKHHNETDLKTILSKRIKQNFDNYQITKLHPADFVKTYFPHLASLAPNLKTKLWRLIFKLILDLNWPWLKLVRSYDYFKKLNIAAIKYGQLSNVVQKNIR